MSKFKTPAPMQTQRSNATPTFAIEGMRLLDGETPEQIAAREAAAEAERVAAEAAAEAARVAAEKAAKDAEDAEAKRIEDEKKAGKLTDKEYEFLTDAMAHKKAAREAKKALEEANEKLKSFDGVDVAKLKELIATETAAKEAAAKAAREAIEKSGDIEKIKKMMAEDHEKQVKTIKDQLLAKDTEAASAQKIIEDLTVGSAFSQSDYISKELVLTPTIARQVYSSHFDVIAGKIKAFDKPRGETGRTELVGANGQSLGVDDALRKLVEASPDRDKLVRASIKPGAGSRTDNNGRGTDQVDTGLRGMARIQAGLAAGQLKITPTK